MWCRSRVTTYSLTFPLGLNLNTAACCHEPDLALIVEVAFRISQVYIFYEPSLSLQLRNVVSEPGPKVAMPALYN